MAARLHHLVFAASLAVVLVAVAASPVHGAAGEGREWTVPPPRNGSGETPTRWAMRHRFYLGDVLDFKNWGGPVLVVRRRRDYDRCDSSSPVFRFADATNATAASARLRLLGSTDGHQYGLLLYFIAAAPPRCEAGERMAMRVYARYSYSSISAAPATAPAVAPKKEAGDDAGPKQDAADQGVPSDKPWKKVVYVVLGFLAGGLFTILVLFVCIRCFANHN